MLDRQLAAHGQTAELLRGDPDAPDASVTVKVRSSDYRLDELAGNLKQGDSKVILSPTGLGPFGVPVEGDWIRYSDRLRSIASAVTHEPQDVIVRIELVARG